MLMTDGNPNSPEDLRAYETAILDVAHIEQIDLDVKLRLSTEDVSEIVLDFLLDHDPSTDPQGTMRRMLGVSDIVVSPQIKKWHALHTLELVYLDAFNNQLNDRYQAKVTEYHNLARDAQERTFRFGIGQVLQPIPIAMQPTFAVVPGLLPATTFYVEVSWISASGQEGQPSRVTTASTVDGSLLVVNPGTPPAIATAFNVFLGLAPNTLALQNSTPIPAGQTFTEAPGGLAAGTPPGHGQTPDTYITGGQSLRRG